MSYFNMIKVRLDVCSFLLAAFFEIEMSGHTHKVWSMYAVVSSEYFQMWTYCLSCVHKKSSMKTQFKLYNTFCV